MKKKILIIEDDSILQKAIKTALLDAGFNVIQAFDGKKGFELVKKENPDVVLLDLILPEKAGLDVLRQMKNDEEVNDIPVLVFTVYETDEIIAECTSLGARGFFFKSSYSLEEVIHEIREVLK